MALTHLLSRVCGGPLAACGAVPSKVRGSDRVKTLRITHYADEVTCSTCRAVVRELGARAPASRCQGYGKAHHELLWSCHGCGRVLCLTCEGNADTHPDLCDECVSMRAEE